MQFLVQWNHVNPNTNEPQTSYFINPLTPGAFCQKVFFYILELFRLDMGQISSNLVQKAFATWQLAFLSTSITFYLVTTLWLGGMQKNRFWTKKWPPSLGFSIFFFLSFFSFSFLFAAVIDLLLGLLVVKKTSKKASSRRAIFTME